MRTRPEAGRLVLVAAVTVVAAAALVIPTAPGEALVSKRCSQLALVDGSTFARPSARVAVVRPPSAVPAGTRLVVGAGSRTGARYQSIQASISSTRRGPAVRKRSFAPASGARLRCAQIGSGLRSGATRYVTYRLVPRRRGGRDRIVVFKVTAQPQLGAGPACSVAAQTASCKFVYSGGERTFAVPAGVTTLNVVAVGATAGRGGYYNGRKAGRGAIVSGAIQVQGGQTLFVEVGGHGSDGSHWGTGGGGGFNGGGRGGYGGNVVIGGGGGGGGGGASDVRTCSATATNCSTLGSRLLVAGGGGGGDSFYGDTARGGNAGQSGGNEEGIADAAARERPPPAGAAAPATAPVLLARPEPVVPAARPAVLAAAAEGVEAAASSAAAEAAARVTPRPMAARAAEAAPALCPRAARPRSTPPASRP